MIQMNIFTKQEWIHRYRNNFMVTKGERDKLGVGDLNIHTTIYKMGFPSDSMIKGPATNAGDEDLNPGLGRYLIEKKMATNSYILAWEIPWTEEPGELQSMGQQKSWP